MHALLALTRRQHPELHPRPGGRVLDARLPARVHRPVRPHLPGQRRRPADDRLGRRGPDSAGAVKLQAGVRRARWRHPDRRDPRGRAVDDMQVGKVDSVIVVPAGYGAALAASQARPAAQPTQIEVYTDPSRPQLQGSDLPGGRHGARHRQPGRPAAARRPEPADGPDREPQRDQLLRAEHARPVDHAGRHLRGHPARGRPREAHPQAARGDAAPALAAGRLERADAACSSRSRRRSSSSPSGRSCSASRSSAA